MQKTTILAIAIICVAAIVIINFFNVPKELPSTEAVTIEESIDTAIAESENTNIFNLEDVGTRHQDVLTIIEGIENKIENDNTENTKEVMQKPANDVLKEAVQMHAPIKAENVKAEGNNDNILTNIDPSENSSDIIPEATERSHQNGAAESAGAIIDEIEKAKDALDTNE